jgi:hypothetical protein
MPNFNPKNPTKFLGTNKFITFFVTRNRRPTSADYRQPETGSLYSVGTVWQVGKDPTTGTEGELWMLSKIVANAATWIQLQANVEILEQFTTNLGGPVVPDGDDNIFVDASVTTFTDGTVDNTLKIEVQGTDHALFVGRGTEIAAANLSVGATGHTLIGATGADPVFAEIGTNSGLTDHGVVIAQGNGAFVATDVGTTGYTLIGATGADPVFAEIGTNSNLTGLVVGNTNSPFTAIPYVPITVWTPTITGATIAGDTTYTVQSGSYSRLGAIVTCNFSVVWTATTGTGDLYITDFPYNFGGAQPRAPLGTIWPDSMTWPADVKYFVGQGGDATTIMVMQGIKDGAAAAPMQMQGTGTINGTITYLTSDPV